MLIDTATEDFEWDSKSEVSEKDKAKALIAAAA
jgi:hypothetical protein